MPYSNEEALLDISIRNQLLHRNEAALSQVQAHWGKLLQGLAYRITGSFADAEECVNDALMDLWQHPPTDPDLPVLAYASTLVRRRALDKLRYRRAQRRAQDALVCPLDELDECLSDPEGQGEADASAIRDALQAFLDDLDEGNRKIFLLRYYAVMSNRDVALRCGIGERAVEMRLNRMRKRLRSVLHEHGIYL